MSAPRPGQVTFLSWVAIVGSAMVIATGFEQVAGLRSLDTKASVEEFLAEPPGSGTGLSVTEALEVLRISTMVSVACAGAILVLGFWLLRGNRQARLASAVFAVPLFASGFISGGLMSAVVAASAMMLWFSPAKHFFDGTTPPPVPSRPGLGGRERRDADSQPPAVWPPPRPDEPRSLESSGPSTSQPTGSQPSGSQPSGSQPAGSAEDSSAAPGQLAPYTTVAPPRPPEGETADEAPVAPASWPAAAAYQPVTRPLSVVWACLVTWLGTLFVGFALLASIVLLALNPDAMMTEVLAQNPEVNQEGISTTMLAGVSLVMLAGMLLWAVAAGVLAVFVMRGHEWARITLLASAALVAVLSLLMALVAPPTLVLSGASVAVIVLLLRPDSAAWMRTRRE